MPENALELVRSRTSVRTYSGKKISGSDMEKLIHYMEKVENPYGIPVDFCILDVNDDKVSSPVVVGAETYIAAKVQHIPHAEEAFGYSFEALVLYAQSLGLGTVWLGGTFDRSAFEKAIGLGENEIMPCVTPIGYPAEKRSIRDSLIRKGAGSDKREDFGNLFFSEGFDTPLSKKDAGRLYIPFEMVRWAPSAVNRQPWRVVVSGNSVHFYKKQSKGYSNSAIGDLQKVDLGIAMYHLAYGLDEAGISYDFTVSDPQIKADENIKYTATFNINS